MWDTMRVVHKMIGSPGWNGTIFEAALVEASTVRDATNLLPSGVRLRGGGDALLLRKLPAVAPTIDRAGFYVFARREAPLGRMSDRPAPAGNWNLDLETKSWSRAWLA